MPQTPKAPSQRRRRNAGQSQWRQLPAEGSSAPAPPLPEGGWLDSTREWWGVIWSSPMATVWQPADHDGLYRLARMRDDFHRGDLPVSAFGAMTTLEDRLGLSPKARRALQWEIAEAAKKESPAGKRHLRAVA